LIYAGARARSPEAAELRVEAGFRPWVVAIVLAVNVTLMLAPPAIAFLALAGVLR
jgi:hypothetical protein